MSRSRATKDTRQAIRLRWEIVLLIHISDAVNYINSGFSIRQNVRVTSETKIQRWLQRGFRTSEATRTSSASSTQSEGLGTAL